MPAATPTNKAAAEAATPPADLPAWISAFNDAGHTRTTGVAGKATSPIRLIAQAGTYHHQDPDAPDGHTMVWAQVEGFKVETTDGDSEFAPYYLLCDCQIKNDLSVQGSQIAATALACPYVQGQCRTRLLTLARALDYSRGSRYLESHVITGGNSQEAADRTLLMVLACMVMKGVFVGNALGGRLTIDDLRLVFANRYDDAQMRSLLLALERAKLIDPQSAARTIFIKGDINNFHSDLQQAFPALIPA